MKPVYHYGPDSDFTQSDLFLLSLLQYYTSLAKLKQNYAPSGLSARILVVGLL
jgi:hypothetical protein